MSLADALYKIRTRRRETMTAFAQRLGVGHSAVSKYESGKLIPGRSLLILLLQYAETEEERKPILDALGIDQDLRTGWPPGELEETLRSFDIFKEARIKDQTGPKKLPDKDALTDFADKATLIVRGIGRVDRSVVEILEAWIRYHDRPGVAEAFAAASAVLALELPRFEKPAAPQRKKTQL